MFNMRFVRMVVVSNMIRLALNSNPTVHAARILPRKKGNRKTALVLVTRTNKKQDLFEEREQFYDYSELKVTEVNPLITTAVRTFYAKESRSVASYEYVKKATTNKDKYIIDLRNPNEVASTGMIPSSINIPVSYLDSALVMTAADFQRVYKRGKPSKTDDLIFYCRTGQLAKVASNRAIKLGFLSAKAYVGSWEDWVNHVEQEIKTGKPNKMEIKTEEPDQHK